MPYFDSEVHYTKLNVICQVVTYPKPCDGSMGSVQV